MSVFVLGLIALSLSFFAFGTFWGRTHQIRHVQKPQSNDYKLDLNKAYNFTEPQVKDIYHDEDVFNPQSVKAKNRQALRIGVFGDSMSDGLWAGLYREIGGQASLFQFGKQATGLANYDYYNTLKEAEKKIEKQPIDIAIIVLGTNDQMGISGGEKLTSFGSPSWDKAYANRIIELIGLFKAKDIPVYWVGLPIMRDKQNQEWARKLGRIYARYAMESQVSFIDTSRATAGQDGSYSERLVLPNENIPKTLRAPDGVHFKMEGYRLLALPVIATINRDLNAAGIEPFSPKSLQKIPNQTTVTK